jgi:hypothetical protein
MIADNFKKRDAGSIVVHETVLGFFHGIGRMDEFASVFFEVNPFDSDPIGLSVVSHDFDEPIFTKGPFVLGDLISFGEIGIEIVFSGKSSMGVNGAAQGQPGTDGVFHRLFVQYG